MSANWKMLPVLALLMAGCSVPEESHPVSAVAVPPAFDQAGTAEAAATPGSLASWWRQWGDPELDRLVAEGLAANSDIKIAWARVREARSLADIARSALSPTVAAEGGALAGAGDWRYGRDGIVALLPAPGPGFESYAGGLAARWEPDLFGGRADDLAAARARAAAVEQQLAGTRMLVIAEIAAAYLEARGLQRRLAVLDAAIGTLRRLQLYAGARFSAGQASSFDVARLAERVHDEEAARSVLIDRIGQRQRRIAILCGHAPEALGAFPVAADFAMPPAPGGQMPSAVLERRPDIRARAELVRAQAARASSARTDLLPSFTIEFLGQDGRLAVDGLPGLGGTAGLVGLSATLPVFTAGRIHANIAASDARLDEAAAAYDKAVLQALGEVEDHYGLRRALDGRAAEQAASLALARRNQAVSDGLYQGGRRTLQDALEAVLDADRAEDALVETQTAQALATVGLYLALGGGWSAE